MTNQSRRVKKDNEDFVMKKIAYIFHRIVDEMSQSYQSNQEKMRRLHDEIYFTLERDNEIFTPRKRGK